MLRALIRLPIVYSAAAFLSGRRVAIRGWSMYPTLAPGERVLFDALAYRLERPTRGDVVLSRHPTRPSTKLVKRVAALPGDTVTVDGDSWRVDESGGQCSPPPRDAAAGGRMWTLGEDEYFLVGDAPDLSTDARHFGPSSGRDILARAWLVYWPPGSFRFVGGPRSRQAIA